MWVASCAGGETGTQVQAVGNAPFLSAQPRWSAAAPAAGTCFGAALAVADLDGDGARDLIVGEPPCLFAVVTPGRLAIYRGDGDSFADTPVWTTLAWTNPPRGGTAMTLDTGDVDGDGRADLLVAARAGAQVFTGITDLGVPLAAPTYRVPGVGNFGPAALGDVDGDGRHEVVSVRANAATVWRAGGAALGSARVISPANQIIVENADGDGDDDVVVTRFGHSDLYLGCALAAPGCGGGLDSAPAWSVEQPVAGLVPDLDGDGAHEALLTDPPLNASGRIWLHLSDPVTGLTADAVWSTLADPNYPVLGRPVVLPGDLDGDQHAREVLVAAAGRIYAFFPRANHPEHLEAGFAWPRADLIQDQILAGELRYGSLAVAAAGRVDADPYADLIIAELPDFGDTRHSVVHLFGGGKVPPEPIGGPPPYLPGEVTCALPYGALPDLFVDPDALARSLHVEERDFPLDSCELVEACVDAPGTRRLLRFATSIANLGGSPAIIPGPETAPELYHFDECHGHDHLEDFAAYEMLDTDGVVVAVGRKQGFFLIDIAPYCSDGEPRFDYFPDQGISPGWSDVYVSSLPCQWLDITAIPDGTYTLRVTADTNGLVAQDDIFPDTATLTIELSSDRVTVVP